MKLFDNGEFETYKDESRERWGKTAAYQEYEAKAGRYSDRRLDNLSKGMEHILARFADCMQAGNPPGSCEALALAEKLQTYISENYYLCTKEILNGLGQMYVADTRFQKNIDRHGNGTALFISDAIKVFCSK